MPWHYTIYLTDRKQDFGGFVEIRTNGILFTYYKPLLNGYESMKILLQYVMSGSNAEKI